MKFGLCLVNPSSDAMIITRSLVCPVFLMLACVARTTTATISLKLTGSSKCVTWIVAVNLSCSLSLALLISTSACWCAAKMASSVSSAPRLHVFPSFVSCKSSKKAPRGGGRYLKYTRYSRDKLNDYIVTVEYKLWNEFFKTPFKAGEPEIAQKVQHREGAVFGV